MCDGGLGSGGFNENAAVVSCSQLAQAELGGGEVIDACIEVRKMTADQIKLDFIQRSRAGGGTKVDFAAGIFSVPGDASGEVEQLGDSFQIRCGCGLGRNDFGDGGKRGYAALTDLGRQGRRLQRGIDLERYRLVVEVEKMRVVVDAGVGVLGGVVIVPGGFGITVEHGM